MSRINTKIKEENSGFLDAIFSSIEENKENIYQEFFNRTGTLHKVIFPIYIFNHYKNFEFQSNYYSVLISNVIESQTLLTLGFYNSGMNILRSVLESAFKLFYYETHPVENILHIEDSHALTITEYREFIYLHPVIKKLHAIEKEQVESIWKDLCAYVHNDIKKVKAVTVLTDIKSIYSLGEHEYQSIIGRYKKIVKIIVTLFLVLNNEWTKEMEKDYYDLILRVYSPGEIANLKEVLTIY